MDEVVGVELVVIFDNSPLLDSGRENLRILYRLSIRSKDMDSRFIGVFTHFPFSML